MAMPRRHKERRRKRRSRYLTGKLTDTEVRRIEILSDGDIHKVRVNGTSYPKDTAVAICRPLKKLNDLIPKEKRKVIEHLVASRRGERELLREHLEFRKEAARVLELTKTSLSVSGKSVSP